MTNNTPARYRATLILLAILVPVYALGYRGTIDSYDATLRFEAAQSVINGYGYTIVIDGERMVPGYGPLHSLTGLPLLIAGRLIAPALTVTLAEHTGVAASPGLCELVNRCAAAGGFMLAMPLASLVTAVLLLQSFILLGSTPGRSLALALIWALASPSLVYANLGFDEPLQGLFLLAAVYAALSGRGWSAGISLGLASLVRMPALLAVPAIFLLLTGSRPRLRFMAVIVLLVLGHAGYNAIMFGHPATSGYAGQGFSTPLAVGLAGQLFAPGKSIFIYAPFTMLLFWSLPHLYRRNRRLAIAAGYLFISYLALYSCWWDWSGDTCWGLRFLVPLLPIAALTLHALPPQRGAHFLLLVLFIAGALVAVPGAMVSYTLLWQQLLESAGDGQLALDAWRYDWPSSAAILQVQHLSRYGPDTILLSAHWGKLVRGRDLLTAACIMLLLLGGTSAIRFWKEPHEFTDAIPHTQYQTQNTE